MEDLVSIVVPIYNAEKTLGRCVESLQSQTFVNIEIILINDGSQDRSFDVASGYARKDKRIVLFDQVNAGASAARNCALTHANGEYILFVDADDYVSHDYVACLYGRIKDLNTDVVISNGRDFDDAGLVELKNKFSDVLFFNGRDSLKELLRGYYFSNVCWGKIFSRKAIGEVEFDVGIKIAEDLKFLHDVFVGVDAVAVVPDVKYYHYKRVGSLTRSGFNSGWMDEIDLCKSLAAKYIGTDIERYAVKRYGRIVVDVCCRYELPDEIKKKLVYELKKIGFSYVFNPVVPLKHKVKYFLCRAGWSSSLVG